MGRRSGKSIMTLVFASRRGLSLLTPFPAILLRNGSTCIPSPPKQLSPFVASKSTIVSYDYQPIAPPVQRCGAVRALVTPLSMAAAGAGKGGSPSIGGGSRSSSGSRPGHHPSSTSPSPTSSLGGAKRRLSPDTTAAYWRPGSSPRTAPLSTSAAGGWGQASAGGMGPTRELHDDIRSKTPRPQNFGEVPEDQLQVTFTRSSGSGGQNVNKVSTKVEMRFVVSEAEWLPHDVRLRLARQEKGRINNKGELVVTAQEFRTQKQNRSHALQKLRDMVNEAWEPAKERKMRTGISKKGKEMRRKDKLHRSKVKSGRSKLSSREFE